ncbi:Gcv operon activator [Variovorax sp. SRS16]|uniref:LysR substrate-binding domain-containing protein n=1 Tax=Variovorax sp. SRS16 TaxID=282217 RepID=UPI001319246C|nr:LysR substrate-binding domain-containing protein [Variovorax sp. SRS16]VTU15373.1 Gcv operon activator [Variovorax sp. SRS16]
MSFKKAALELCVSPTAISHQIRLLERYCGCALFRRRPRPLALTDAGARLFPAVRGGLEAFAAAIAAVKRDGEQQPLRVTATNAFASRWRVPRLPAWRKLHPHVPLEVIGTDTVLDLQAGDGDVAIRYATRREMPTDGIVDALVSDTFWPICSPRLLPAGALKRPADLARHVLVHAYWGPADRELPTWQRWLAAAARRWRDVPEFKDMQHLTTEPGRLWLPRDPQAKSPARAHHPGLLGVATLGGSNVLAISGLGRHRAIEGSRCPRV